MEPIYTQFYLCEQFDNLRQIDPHATRVRFPGQEEDNRK